MTFNSGQPRLANGQWTYGQLNTIERAARKAAGLGDGSEEIKLGSTVKWKNPGLDNDNMLKKVVEDNGDRVIIQEIDAKFSSWNIKPTFLAHKRDLVIVKP